ncbi:hypothetical protein R5R35_001117 [Gryllus longicercus]|uniref:Accessory gland protein n=1 Tax=Gryllus longicercus TaxID=2509291 RepID=A0AAN9Z931_9ORTH
MWSHWMLLLSAAAGGLAWNTKGFELGGQRLFALPPVEDPGPCVPPHNMSSAVGLRGYRRYFANDSLIGRPVPCTRDDKICFRHNLVFDPSLDRCQPVGRGKLGCDLRPNRNEFEKGGHIIGVCNTYKDPCKGYRMAYDGRCYRKEVVRDVICGCGVKLTHHILSGVECRKSPATPVTIRQPKGERRCLMPDLRFPDVERSQFFRNPFWQIIRRTTTRNGTPENSFQCNTEQLTCFSKGKISVKGFSGCYPLFDKGPCPREYKVALDIHSAVKGQAEGTCVHERGGCPRGYKRMLFDGKCHEARKIAIEAPGYTPWNEYGQFMVLPHYTLRDVTFKRHNEFCMVMVGLVGSGMWERRPEPPCGANNKDLCHLYEVEAEPPIPEL